MVDKSAHPILREIEIILERCGGYSLEALAKNAGINRSAVNRWMHGAEPKLSSIEAMLECMGYELRIMKKGSKK